MDQPSTPLFRPQRVFVEQAVKDLAYTQEILARLGSVEVEEVKSARDLKMSTEITWAKKGLLLAEFKADPLKEFKAMTVSTGRPTYSLNLISNCHLECSYCILQSYLANNPIITIYTNLDDVMERLTDQMERIPRGSIIGTGQIADSLALEEITRLNARLIPFFGEQDRIRLELKTKSADVESLLQLEHNGQTVVSWSMAPAKIQVDEEYKTATIADRIKAIKSCQQAGYDTGIHFDPVIHHTGWEKQYKAMIDQLFGAIDGEKVPWVSIGTLRFPSRQVRTMRERFPNNRKIFNNLISTKQRVMHYPDRLREALYARMRQFLEPHVASDKIYVSMEAEQTEVPDASSE